MKFQLFKSVDLGATFIPELSLNKRPVSVNGTDKVDEFIYDIIGCDMLDWQCGKTFKLKCDETIYEFRVVK